MQLPAAFFTTPAQAAAHPPAFSPAVSPGGWGGQPPSLDGRVSPWLIQAPGAGGAAEGLHRSEPRLPLFPVGGRRPFEVFGDTFSTPSAAAQQTPARAKKPKKASAPFRESLENASKLLTQARAAGDPVLDKNTFHVRLPCHTLTLVECVASPVPPRRVDVSGDAGFDGPTCVCLELGRVCWAPVVYEVHRGVSLRFPQEQWQ